MTFLQELGSVAKERGIYLEGSPGVLGPEGATAAPALPGVLSYFSDSLTCFQEELFSFLNNQTSPPRNSLIIFLSSPAPITLCGRPALSSASFLPQSAGSDSPERSLELRLWTAWPLSSAGSLCKLHKDANCQEPSYSLPIAVPVGCPGSTFFLSSPLSYLTPKRSFKLMLWDHFEAGLYKVETHQSWNFSPDFTTKLNYTCFSRYQGIIFIHVCMHAAMHYINFILLLLL